MNINYEELSVQELREIAKQRDIVVGNSGKDKIIEKLKESDAVKSVLVEDDDDLKDDVVLENVKEIKEEVDTKKSVSLLDSITSAIDELEDASDDEVEVGLDSLSLDIVIPVKSITFGGLTYKSRTTNAMFKWDKIGALQYMSVAELLEMNNYKGEFLNRPLVILMDERAIKKFRLTPVYEKVSMINNLKELFASDINTIASKIEMAEKVGMREVLISKVRQMLKNRTLVDINIIKLLENKLRFDFSDILNQKPE